MSFRYYASMIIIAIDIVNVSTIFKTKFNNQFGEYVSER